MKSTVTVLGSTLIDVIFELPKRYLLRHATGAALSLPFGEKLASDNYSMSLGGSGANVAVGLETFSLEVTLRTTLSTDPFGDFARAELKERGVELLESKSAQPMPLSLVLRLGGERTIITGSHDQAGFLQTALPKTGWIHLGPLSDKQDDVLQKITSHQIQTGQQLSCNPSMAQVEQRSRVFMAMLKTLDVIFVNRQEAFCLARAQERAAIADVVRTIHAFGVKIICLTDGERGAYVSNGSHLWFAEAVCDKASRLDATGAGDSFATGFLGWYITGEEKLNEDELCEQALRSAMLNSGSVVASVGAQAGLLSREKIEPDLGTVKLELIR